jgi:tetratricopeptide (TPR) repeat protein
LAKINPTKIKAFKYLNINKDRIEDMKSTDIVIELCQHLKLTYAGAVKYWYAYKEEVLKIPVVHRKKIEANRPRLKKIDDCVYAGEYGEHSNNGDDGLLLEKGKAYLNFGSRDECIKFFNEALAAYEKIGLGV